MAISRLLLPRPGGTHLHGRGLIQSTNGCSSSPFSSVGSEKFSFLRGLKTANESKAVDKESKKESGTWFKGILTNMKQRMLGSPQIQKSGAGETSDCKVDKTASDVATKVNSSQSVPPSPEVIMSSTGGTDVSSCSTPDTVGKNASGGPVVSATSEVSKMLNDPDPAGLGDIQSTFKPSETLLDSDGNDKLRTLASNRMVGNSCSKINQSKNPKKPIFKYTFVEEPKNEVKQFEEAMSEAELRSSASDTMVGNSSTKVNQSQNLSDTFVKRPNNGVKQFVEAMSDVLVDSDKEGSQCADDLSGFTAQLIVEKPKSFPDGTKYLPSSESMKHLVGNKNTASVERPNASTNSSKNGKSPMSSSGAKTLANIFQIKNNDPILVEMAAKLNEPLAPAEISKGKKVERKLEIQDLLRRIKWLPGEQSTIKAWEKTESDETDQPSNGGFPKNYQSRTNLQDSDVKRRHTLLKHPISSGDKMSLDKKEESSIPTESIGDREEYSSLSLTDSDHVKSENSQVPLPISREELNSSMQTCISNEGSKKNEVLVRFFTKNVLRQNVFAALCDCGTIMNVEEVSSTNGSIFKDFLVHFETRNGCQNALKKNDLLVFRSGAIVEETSSEDMDNAISVPDLIGDPDAPVTLVKNPTRTVKVQHLTEDINSQQLKEAFAFCHSGISSIFLGSTSSVRYVEFETEDAKERALAEHSLLVSGKEFPILRIDAPRTTVVRISNIIPKSKILKTCYSYGKIKNVIARSTGIVDVHFELAEWPNMLNIVNSLNGKDVNGRRLLVQPAPVFPLAVLKALWSRPEERQHVKAVICNLSRNLDRLSSITDLVSEYYGKNF